MTEQQYANLKYGDKIWLLKSHNRMLNDDYRAVYIFVVGLIGWEQIALCNLPGSEFYYNMCKRSAVRYSIEKFGYPEYSHAYIIHGRVKITKQSICQQPSALAEGMEKMI